MHSDTAIPARYNGPPASGNGGYSCGVLAGFIEGPARIRLHVPPPLDTPLRVVETDGGGAQMYDGDSLVASGTPASFELEIPDPPSLEEAGSASDHFPCYRGHTFPTCFVCGPDRPAHDGLELFPGSVSGGSLLACRWQPGEDTVDGEGNIRPEILWSALDCPGYFAAMGDELRPALLGELAAQLDGAVSGAQSLVVYAWPLGVDGRKFYAATAIATASGVVVASAKSTWIVLRA